MLFCYKYHVNTKARKRHTHLLAQRAQLLRIHPVPDLLHVVPVGHDAVFHGVLDLEQTAELLGALADEGLVFQRACEDSDVFGAADAGFESLVEFREPK